MGMKVWLEGKEFDLQDLADLLPTGDTRVERNSQGFFLAAKEIDEAGPDEPYYEVAARVLQRINGLARAADPNFRPVRLGGRYQDGHRVHIVVGAASIEARARIRAAGVVATAGGASAPEIPRPGPARALFAASEPDVDEALRILGEGDKPDWIGMWKVYEIVRESVRPETITSLGWATRAEVSAFGASANRSEVSGAAARHARLPGKPPLNTYTIDEGRHFISRLVTSWIDGAREVRPS